MNHLMTPEFFPFVIYSAVKNKYHKIHDPTKQHLDKATRMQLSMLLACASIATTTVGASTVGLRGLVSKDVNFACIKTQPEYTALMPLCAQYCHALALTTDGCAPDDHICHCKNFSKTASIIEPCIFGPNPGPAGSCNSDEISQFAGTGAKYCTFWNQTTDDTIQGKFRENKLTCKINRIFGGKE